MTRWRGRLGVFAVLAAVISLAAVALPVQASVQNFYFSSFEADYYLSKDDEGRSVLKVDETLTAQFPEYDQNKGIERAIPKSYDGHSVSLVFDDASLMRNGQPEPVYEKRNEGGNLVVGTGTNDYVRGQQVYTFSYTMRDVTKDFGDHQEFYWDTNGTQWSQRFNSVTARVHLNASLADAWLKNEDCYEGIEGSNATCDVTPEEDEDGVVVTYRSTGPLYAGENLTLVMGFKEGTFAGHVMGTGELVEYFLRYAVIIAAVVGLIWGIVVQTTKGRNHPGRGTIVPEYLPPKDVSVLVANDLYGKQNNKATAAQLVDFAVRHNIQIVEYDKPGLFGTQKKYKLKLLTYEGLNADESAFLRLFFPSSEAGAEYDMADTTQNYTTGMRMGTYIRALTPELINRGLRKKYAGKYWPALVSWAALIVAIIMTAVQSDAWAGICVVVAFIGSSINMGLVTRKWPLTERGAEIRDYVKGLKMYITVAEEERLKVLQSVEGAERQAIGDVNDRAQLVKLYERVLPYAVLLGLEKSWGKVLEQYYDAQTTPSWYVGTAAFNMANFSSSLSSFTASTSSSSSGMSGGGSSGGGGGGGGGGGR